MITNEMMEWGATIEDLLMEAEVELEEVVTNE
mgnify:CR=1 FL=1